MGQEINKATSGPFGQCKMVIKDENQYYVAEGEGINCDVVFPEFKECSDLPNLAAGTEYGVYGLRAMDDYSGYVAQVRRSADGQTKDFTASEFLSGDVQTWVAGSSGGSSTAATASYSLRKTDDSWSSAVITGFRQVDSATFDFTVDDINGDVVLDYAKFQDQATPLYGNSTPAATLSLRDLYDSGNPVVQVRRKSDGVTRNLLESDIKDGFADIELLQSPDFSSSTGWSPGTGWSVSAGSAVLDGTQSVTSYLIQDLPSSPGDDLVLVEIDIVSCSDFSQCGMRLGGNTNRTFIQMDIDKVGKHKVIVNRTLSSPGSQFRFFGFSGAQLEISSASARAYTPSEIEQWALEGAAWTASTPFTRYDEDGADVVAWFNQDATWQESHPDPAISDPGLWDIPAGSANATVSAGSISMQNNSYTQVNTVDVDYLVEGKVYVLEMDIASQTTASRFAVRTQGDAIRPINITSGKFVQLIRCQASFNKQVWVQTNGSTNGADSIEITGFSIKEVDHSFYQQTTIDQPSLAPSCVLSTIEDRPAIYFDGDSFLRCINPDNITAKADYAIVAQTRDPESGRYALVGSDSITSVSQAIFIDTAGVISAYGGSDPASAANADSTWSYNEQNQVTVDFNRANQVTIQVDLDPVDTGSADNIAGQQGGIRIGSDRRVIGSALLDGYVQEVLIYKTNEPDVNRQSVKHSQLWYYDPDNAPNAIMKVVKWFDQSGNGIDLVAQGSHAPYIINGSDYYYSNGLPSLFFTGVDGEFMITDTDPNMANGYSYVAAVVEPQINGTASYFERGCVFDASNNELDASNQGFRLGFDSQNLQVVGGPNSDSAQYPANGSQIVLSAEIDSSSAIVNIDFNEQINDSDNYSPFYQSVSQYKIGGRTDGTDQTNGVDNFCGMIQEVVFSDTDLQGGGSLIESSMIQYYKSTTPPNSGDLDGYVSVLYDQGQNANHLYQADPLRQPLVVDGGVLVAKSGKPVMLFNESTQFSNSSFAGLAAPVESFWVFQPDPTNDGFALPSDSGAAGETNRGLTVSDGGGGDPNSLPLSFSDSQAAYSLRHLSDNPSSQNVIRVRRSSDQSERNFSPSEISGGQLLSWVDGSQLIMPSDYESGAAGAYSLRYVSDNYSGPVIRVRRTDDDLERDFTPEEITDGTLEEFVSGSELEIADFTNTPSSAWSLRSLDPDYTGPVCRIRRDINDELRDFTAEEILDGTLMSWASGEDEDILTDADAAYGLRSIDGDDSKKVVRLRRDSDDAERDFTAAEIVGGATGDELITNGDFATDSDWIKGDGWSITGGQAVCDGSQASLSYLRQDGIWSPIADGEYYVMEFEIVACSDFSSCGTFGGIGSTRSFSSTYDITGVGTYRVIRKKVSDGGNFESFRFYASTGETLTIDNVSLKPHTPTAAELWAIENAPAGTGRQDADSAYVTIWYDQVASGDEKIQDPSIQDPSKWTSNGAGIINIGNGSIYMEQTDASNPVVKTSYTIPKVMYRVEIDYVNTSSASNDYRTYIGGTSGSKLIPSGSGTLSFDYQAKGEDQLTIESINAAIGSTLTLTRVSFIDLGNPISMPSLLKQSQPKLITAGVTELENGQPAMLFDGVDDELTTAYGSLTTTNSIFGVVKADSTSDDSSWIQWVRSGVSSAVSMGQGGLGTAPEWGLRLYEGSDTGTSGIAITTDQTLLAGLTVAGTSAQIYANGIAGSLSTSARMEINKGTSIGSTGFNNLFSGKIQEIIVYESDQSANRELIESNINNYYSIFNDTPRSATLETWYDQSGNSRHATATSANFEPYIVLDGVLIEEGGRPAIIFGYQGRHLNINGNIGFSGDQARSMFSVSKATTTKNSGPGIIGRDTVEGTGSDWAICFENSRFAVRVKCFLAGLPSCNGNAQYSSSNMTEHTMLTVILPDGGRTFDHQLWKNGSSIARSGGTNRDINTGQTDWNIGKTGEQDNVLFDGIIQEIILFDSNQLANRAFIEGNQRAYYGIEGDGSGAVTKWYDQSGNSRDFVQTDQSKQPLIVVQSSLVTENGKPAIQFDGVSHGMLITNGGWSDSAGSYTFNMVSTQEGSGYAVSTWGASSAQDFFIEGDTRSYRSDNSWRGNGGWRDGSQHILSLALDGSAAQQGKTFLDKNSLQTGLFYSPTSFPSGQAIGLMQNPGSNNNRVLGKFQELIVYSSFEEEARAQIESNMNDYYQVYSSAPTGFGFVVTLFDQGPNGLHLFSAVANQQPIIVDDGNLNVQGGQPAIMFDGVDDSLYNGSVFISQPNSVFTVVASLESNQNKRVWNIGNGSSGQILFYRTNDTRSFAGGSSIASGTNLDNYLYTNIFDGANTEAYANGNEFGVLDAIGTNGGNGLLLGGDNSDASNRGKFNFQEMVLYSGNKSDEREDISANILNHYSDLPNPVASSYSLTQNYGSSTITINGLEMPVGSDAKDAFDIISTSELNLVYQSGAQTSAWSDFVIGSTQGLEYKGLVAEFSVYNQGVSSDRDCIEQGIQQYYNLD